MLEGLEVVFIDIGVGAGGVDLLIPASLGALAALVVVVALGLVVHRPLSRIPENTLKFVVGVLLSAFGSFWVGEGFGLAWPGHDWSDPRLDRGLFRRRNHRCTDVPRTCSQRFASPLNRRTHRMSWLKTIFREVFGLFVDEGSFAVAILVWLALLWWLLPHLPIGGLCKP